MKIRTPEEVERGFPKTSEVIERNGGATVYEIVADRDKEIAKACLDVIDSLHLPPPGRTYEAGQAVGYMKALRAVIHALRGNE